MSALSFGRMDLRGTAPWTSSEILIMSIYNGFNDYNDLMVLVIVHDQSWYFKIKDIFKIFFQLQPGLLPHHLLGTVGNHGCLLPPDGQVGAL